MRLLDSSGGIDTYFSHDSNTGKNVLKSVQDAEPFIEHNKRMAEGLNKKKDWWFVGSIPNNIIIKWSQECGHKPYTKGWQLYANKQLNSTEYRKLNPNKIQLNTK